MEFVASTWRPSGSRQRQKRRHTRRRPEAGPRAVNHLHAPCVSTGRKTSDSSAGGLVASSQAELMRELHDEHAAALWGYCVRLTNGDRARAQDIVQETLLRAWRNPKILDQAQGSARAW